MVTSAENLTSAKKPLSPPSTQTPQPNPAQKNDHTPSPSQAEIPKPQNPPFPRPPPVTFPLPSQHPSPTQTAPAQLPAAAQHQTRGLFHQPPPTTNTHQPTPTQQLPPLSLRTPRSRRQRTHTWPPAAYKMRSTLSGRVHVAQTGQRNERRSFSFVWDLVIPARGCAQTAAVRIPCRGKGM